MINITKVKIDNRGRIQLPITFIKANNLVNGQNITIKPIHGRNNAIAVIWEEE